MSLEEKRLKRRERARLRRLMKKSSEPPMIIDRGNGHLEFTERGEEAWESIKRTWGFNDESEQ